MTKRCSSCGTEVDGAERACPRCRVLFDTMPTSQERRPLTVVFPDLIGSTPLSQALDPEDMELILNRYRERCAEIVRRWGGHVAQFMGDGILAYFGYPVAYEDDPRRAVGAALEMARVVPTLETPSGVPPLGVRVGINYGVTVVSSVGSGQNLAIGSAPNLAQHFQKFALPNGVVISDSTRRQVAGFYEVESIAEMTSGEGPLYRVVRPTGATRSIDAAATVGLTPFVARSKELAGLDALWARALTRVTTGALVRGEAGIGKSRLVHELKARVARGPGQVLELHCSPDAQGTALRPVAEGLARRFGILDDDPADRRLHKLERGLAALGSLSADNVWLIARLLSIPIDKPSAPLDTSAQNVRKRMLDAILDMVRAVASQQPALVVVEDLHWADPSTLELLEMALERLQDEPVMFVLTARPEFQAPWTTRLEDANLSRLSLSDSEQMIRHLAGQRQLPHEVLEELPPRSEGVPLFVEELARAVLDSGLLADRGDRYELLAPLEEAAIPPNLQASLVARIHRLGACKRVAQVGSVLGRSFSYEMIRAVDDATDADLRRDLAELVRTDCLHVTGEPPEAQWTFKHAMIRDAAYDSWMRVSRRKLHKRIAETLIARFPETTVAQPELVAHHFTEAQAAEHAVPHWLSAGQQALSRSANHEAVDCLTRGLEVVDTLPDAESRANAELTMRVLIGPALMATKGYAHADVHASYTRAHELVKRVGQAPRMFEVLWGLWAQSFVGGQLRAAREPAEHVVRLAHASSDRGLVPPAHHALGFVECYTAHYPETVALVEEGLAVVELDANLDRERQNILKYQFASSLALINMGATALWMLGKPDQARKLAARAKPLAETLGHPPSIAFAITSSSWFLQLAGEASQVLEVMEFVNRLSREEGFAFWPPLVSVFGGWAQMANGDIAGGADTMLESFRLYRASGGGILRTHGFALLAEGLLEADRVTEALATLDEAIVNAHTTGEVHFEPELHRVKGLALLKRAERDGGSEEEAREALERALTLSREQGARWLELRAAISLSRFLRSRGETARALDLLSPIHAAIAEGNDTREMKEAAALIAELRAG
jgi:class 3 adenylate cyclase/tetratricopeptide (TPR) repeat protein